jgi:uridine phosphorylase
LAKETDETVPVTFCETGIGWPFAAVAETATE